jgi:hypothetical protein
MLYNKYIKPYKTNVINIAHVFYILKELIVKLPLNKVLYYKKK